MADGPWRCSQCGTVNEPVANACRTCGRWPSLFELEGSTIESDAPVRDDELAPRSVEIEELEPEVFDTAEVEAEAAPTEVEPEDFDTEEQRPPKPLWRQLTRYIVPIAVVIYIAISALADRS